MASGRRSWLWMAAGAVLLPLALAALWLAGYAWMPGPAASEQRVMVWIPKGTSLEGIRGILASAGLIHDDIRFTVLARLSGSASRLKAGEFSLTAGQKAYQLLRELAAAKPVQHSITLREGLQAAEMGRIFHDGGWCDWRSYAVLVEDKAFIAKLGLTGVESLEGYLYPDTYLLTRANRGAENLISMQVRRFLEVWREVAGGQAESAERQKIVTLASMVEKETGAVAERPLIAGVFANRLRQGMRLQSDPTVIYGVQGHSGGITKGDLQRDTPYNTYRIAGLPAGPIANPGRESLRAALQPARTDYLYFVAKNDGTHHFSTNLSDHNNAVQTYQRRGRDKSSH